MSNKKFAEELHKSTIRKFKKWKVSCSCIDNIRAIMKKKKKDLKGGDIDFQYANNVVAVEWLDKRGVTMVGACLEEYNKVSTM